MNKLKEYEEKQSQEKQLQEIQWKEIQEIDLEALQALHKSKSIQSFDAFISSNEAPKETFSEPEIIVDPDPLLSPASVARMLGVTTQTLRAWHKEGKLNVVTTLGGHRRVYASEVARLMGKEFAPVRVVGSAEEEGF